MSNSLAICPMENWSSKESESCTGCIEYPFENKQGKSCLLHLSCEVDKEEMIEVVVINSAFLERIVHVAGTTQIISSQHR